MQKVFLFTLVLALVLVFVQAQNDCQRKRLADVKAGRTPMRGVGLGSWFILESWISSDLWDKHGCDHDQYQGTWQFEQCLVSQAQSVMEEHWRTWITEDDFQQMSEIGINALRLPVGWWQIYDQWGGADEAQLNYNIEPKNYAYGSLKYVDLAFEWGAKYGIAIILDLHAAPGSQNGIDNSSPSVNNQIYWDKYADNQYETVEAMELYAQRYANHEAILAFQLMNDPVVDLEALQNYHVSAYHRIRQYTDAPIIINSNTNPLQDGTEPEWINFMNPAQYPNVWMDFHLYHCQGGPWDPSNADSVINYIKNDRLAQINKYNKVNSKPMIVGGWSGCGVPESRAKDLLKAQVETYSNAKGWFMWTWKNPAISVWSVQSIIENGWMTSADFAQSC